MENQTSKSNQKTNQNNQQSKAENIQPPDRSTEETQRSPVEESGTPEEAFVAATHGTDDAKPEHPGRVEHPREPTGRHADDTWKHQDS